MTLTFFIRFSTKFGQSLFVSGNHALLGDNVTGSAQPLEYFNEHFWQGQVTIPGTDAGTSDIEYRYILREADGSEITEWGNDRVITFKGSRVAAFVSIDTWNDAGDVANVFYTQAFQVLFKNKTIANKLKKSVKEHTHEFKVKAPLLKEGEVICLTGVGKELGEWKTDAPRLLAKEGNWWTTKVNLADVTYPIAYKYGLYNVNDQQFLQYESGLNRTLPAINTPGKRTIIHDGFTRLPILSWKGAGVAIPVFSLRSSNGLGTGEFDDIKLLVDWARITGLKLIQLLPVNDTTATHSFLDSYPYAAISAFALHPLYLNLDKVAGSKTNPVIKSLRKQQRTLNELPEVDYEQVIKLKFTAVKALFSDQKDSFKNDTRYAEFFERNRHWLVPYAAFCYLRDKYKTADYSKWKTQFVFNAGAIQRLVDPGQKHYDSIAIHYFIQYHLHLQLKEATAYAHAHGIVVKGDLPIGIYRYGCDAWMAPELYNMDAQAGAPPDDFAVKGQNWGFPTYNWKKMQEDGFAWWRKRFEQMSHYFDAFRIDHILGFFRIWSIPLHAVEGIMGRFIPAIPVHVNEFYHQGISFQYHRFCKPFITESIINDRFGTEAAAVKEIFLTRKEDMFELKPEFDTQRKVEAHFEKHLQTPAGLFIKHGLFEIIGNVLLFEEEGSDGQRFHFRINMNQTSSFYNLDEYTKQQLYHLYINYFYHRQDEFWKKEALNKLPELKKSTNMLVCGEDLGMVPSCLPEVMNQLGILSLEIQRMPKDPAKEFFHPADAPYLSVVTPSTHDMSTLRGWWEEDPGKTQRFYNIMLGHYGVAPFPCKAWICKEIVEQHLHSPAMWSIFQLQDLLAMDETLSTKDPNEERINVPADSRHYWRYRMPIGLEDLLQQSGLNDELKGVVKNAGR